jgi:hypothetical protein
MPKKISTSIIGKGGRTKPPTQKGKRGGVPRNKRKGK